jgi:hypothetical protein
MNYLSQINMKVPPTMDDHVARRKDVNGLAMTAINTAANVSVIDLTQGVYAAGYTGNLQDKPIMSGEWVNHGAVIMVMGYEGYLGKVILYFAQRNDQSPALTAGRVFYTQIDFDLPNFNYGNIPWREIGVPGADGVRGNNIMPWNSATTVTNISQVTGAAVGDLILNAYSAAVTILGASVQPGGLRKVTSATAGTDAGSIRGAGGTIQFPNCGLRLSVSTNVATCISNADRSGEYILSILIKGDGKWSAGSTNTFPLFADQMQSWQLIGGVSDPGRAMDNNSIKVEEDNPGYLAAWFAGRGTSNSRIQIDLDIVVYNRYSATNAIVYSCTYTYRITVSRTGGISWNRTTVGALINASGNTPGVRVPYGQSGTYATVVYA